jgi:hypothetical protein
MPTLITYSLDFWFLIAKEGFPNPFLVSAYTLNIKAVAMYTSHFAKASTF